GKSADIVHLGSTLQYIDDWRKLLTDLATQFQPDFFVLSDLLVGDMPSFVTAQNYYGQTIPARFINVGEFLDFWAEKMPYRLVYRSLYQPLSSDDYFSQSGLPETHRIKKPCNLVFAKI
ncbi:MAG: hypothetical protein HY370_08430, partial [Proteobacteria bacterium]|nr:hypothetical protein [Pseudomonadota bacterium]